MVFSSRFCTSSLLFCCVYEYRNSIHKRVTIFMWCTMGVKRIVEDTRYMMIQIRRSVLIKPFHKLVLTTIHCSDFCCCLFVVDLIHKNILNIAYLHWNRFNELPLYHFVVYWLITLGSCSTARPTETTKTWHFKRTTIYNWSSRI